MAKNILSFLLFMIPFFSFSQDINPIQNIWLFPNPGLPRNAANPLFQDSLSLRPFQVHQPKLLMNQINQPLSGQYHFDLEASGEFSLELWLLNHVNQAIGLEVFLGTKSLVGIWDKSFQIEQETLPMKPWRSYWSHLVLIFKNGKVSFFENGTEIRTWDFTGESDAIFIQSYLEEEPYMKLDHWVKHLAIYSDVLSPEQIQEKFSAHEHMRDSGLRYPDTFHFLAEPYLFPSDDGMRITFETDRKANATIRYGKELPFQTEIEVSFISGNIFSQTIPNLDPGTPYFYQVVAKDEMGNMLDSGILTFKTKPKGEVPIVFGVVSDTEARPQINEQIGLQLWDERPDFIIHMGDVTDGGKEKDKWQWTQEYFPGSAALTTRIPMIPTAGNGEGDLFWYNAYHPQAEPGGYFGYTYGAGDFIVLNSNRKDQLQPGGEQYEWLKNELAKSIATWKFIYMHHAPYSSDEDDYGNTWKSSSTYGDREFQPLIRLLEEFNVDVVFFGHLHTYMRTFPLREDQIDLEKGIHFIQVGGMGGNLEDFAPNRAWFAEKTFRGFHYGTVSLTQEKLKLSVYRADGALIDWLEVSK
ncbi:purple acid phosphatase family protein [Algoriphagus litoralis]|uniref:purple acid phosphatase family protein n=1 Tax=Algoriphagus litoralis TaxID=2202829 RepID=UPI000DBA2B75|nr:metallophosphoesterase family protein [Algoriphagus litoralis]